ncbi:MAG: tetratricopeptide repeat protein [Alphaproteobacteria bacterium]|nr:tetratricopeptide repeat protein [Alphaproteobacteria bacterium]
MSKKRVTARSVRDEPPPSAGSPVASRQAPALRRVLPIVGMLILAFIVVLAGLYLGLQKGLFSSLVEETQGSSFVDNGTCVQCHQAAAKAWSQSHHAHAMAKATPATVLGDFSGKDFEHKGVRSRFFTKDGKYVVRTQGADGKPADFEIAYTFGVDPLQEYLIELPGGHLQPLTIAWDVARKRWFQLQPDEDAPPGDWLHWTGRGQNANTTCIGCHTTGFEKRYDAVADSFASRWSEIDVSCQSCHGPGASHVAWANSASGKAAEKTSAGKTGPRYGLAVDYARLDPQSRIEPCAMCHSRRSELTGTFDAGRPFMDQFLPADLRAGYYHADGQQDDEVYVYGSFRQSKMYRLGVTCTDCHDAHTSKLKAEGNAVCTQCHSPTGDRRFPTAAKLFDDPSHHHHPMGSKSAECTSCHMPAKNYMVVHSRPDHGLRVPRPDLSVKIGTPNACTACHTDKPASWAAQAVERWYGHERSAEPHFAEAFAAGRAGQPEARPMLARLVADAQEPAIVRATALDLLRPYGEAAFVPAMQSLGDADPAVRRAAVAALEGARPGTRLAQLAPLLSDPVRAVRIEAARVLSSVLATEFDAAQRAKFEAALAEFVAAQRVSLDTPGAWLNLAVVAENQGRRDEAEQEYLGALRLDPDFTPGRLNLVRFYSVNDRLRDGERILRDGLARLPLQGDLHYSLGLLLAEQNRLSEAVTELAEAARLVGDRPRVHYNHALALQRLGRRPEAEVALLKAQSLAPTDRDTIYALAVFYAQDRRWFLAVPWAEKLVALDPTDPGAQQFLGQLRAASQRDGTR